MAIKKQPEPKAGEISLALNGWFSQFLKVLELSIIEMEQCLPVDASPADCRLAVMRAVKLALLDSGIDDDAITGLFGQVAFEDSNARLKVEWNAEWNKRRFELIDRDIQGALSRVEKLE